MGLARRCNGNPDAILDSARLQCGRRAKHHTSVTNAEGVSDALLACICVAGSPQPYFGPDLWVPREYRSHHDELCSAVSLLDSQGIASMDSRLLNGHGCEHQDRADPLHFGRVLVF